MFVIDKYITPVLKRSTFGYLIEEKEKAYPIVLYRSNDNIIALKDIPMHWYDTWKSYKRRCESEMRRFHAIGWRFATREEILNWNANVEILPPIILKRRI